jgi:hypothetical protein
MSRIQEIKIVRSLSDLSSSVVLLWTVGLLAMLALPAGAAGQSGTENTSRAPDIRRDDRFRFPTPPTPQLRAWISEYQPNSNEKKLLEVDAEDEQRFESVLRQRDTGIMRLFPVTSRRVISLAELAEGRRPGFSRFASMYSFTKGKHGSGLQGYVDPRLGWAELRYQDERFFSGFTGESLGVLVALGNIPLESVSAESDGVIGLTKITPPADHLEAGMLSRRNRAGFNLAKYHYGSSLPAAPDMTYALRSTSNKRADILVVFRVVRVRENGALTLVWRKLKVFPKPSWKRR